MYTLWRPREPFDLCRNSTENILETEGLLKCVVMTLKLKKGGILCVTQTDSLWQTCAVHAWDLAHAAGACSCAAWTGLEVYRVQHGYTSTGAHRCAHRPTLKETRQPWGMDARNPS